jgi:hypothetical protein
MALVLKKIAQADGTTTAINPAAVVRVIDKPPDDAEIVLMEGTVIETWFSFKETVEYLQR